MKEINYIEIIKKAWKITWENRYLWWFGLFLALGGGISFNLPGNSEWNREIEGNSNQLGNFISQHWQLIIAIIVVVAIVELALFVLSLISKAGLIRTLHKIENGLTGNFKEGFREGKKYFWRLLSLAVILSLLIFTLILILVIPVVILFSFNSPVFGVLAAILAILILIPIIILANFIGKYASFYIVLSDLGIRASIENGYQVFRKNILVSIIMSLFFIPIIIALAVSMLVALLVIGLVFLLFGIILYLMLAKIGIVITVSLGGFVFVIFLVLINSIVQVLCQTIWFLFFKEIASVKEEEKVEEAAVEIIEKNIPTPEEV